MAKYGPLHKGNRGLRDKESRRREFTSELHEDPESRSAPSSENAAMSPNSDLHLNQWHSSLWPNLIDRWQIEKCCEGVVFTFYKGSDSGRGSLLVGRTRFSSVPQALIGQYFHFLLTRSARILRKSGATINIRFGLESAP